MSETTEAELFSVGKLFDTRDDLWRAVTQYAIRESFEFNTRRASHTRYEVTCSHPNCHWRIYARTLKNSSIFKIRAAELTHQCLGINHRGHKNITTKFIAETYHDRVAIQSDITPSDITNDMITDYGSQVLYHKAWRGKERALVQINGTHEDAYSLLPKYCELLGEANPGSTISLDRTDQNKFKRVIISFGASGQGLEHCRPLIGLDGTHLKSKYQGWYTAS